METSSRRLSGTQGDIASFHGAQKLIRVIDRLFTEVTKYV
jgi:hypothetical protein